MIEYYRKGQKYDPGTILKWKNGTKVQIQQNGGHKIVSTKKINFKNSKQSGGKIDVKKIITHVKGETYSPGTFLKLSNNTIAVVKQNGGYTFLYKQKSRTLKSKRKQYNNNKKKKKTERCGDGPVRWQQQC